MKTSIILLAMAAILLACLLSTSLAGCSHCTKSVIHMHSVTHVDKKGVHVISYPESVCVEWSDK